MARAAHPTQPDPAVSGDLLGAPAPPPPGLWDAALDRAVSVSGDDPALALLVPDLWTEPDGPAEPDADDQHDQHDQHDDHDHARPPTPTTSAERRPG